ncbi:MAG: helix-turn-helix domain-containing protein [Caldilineaceae bacterium]
MNLDSVTAQHIVDQIASSLGTDVWIVDPSSHILASTQLQDPHWSPAPFGLNEGACNDHRLTLPLCYANQEVGTLIITGSSQQNQEAAHIAKTLADLIIYQTTVLDQLVDRQLALNQLVYHLLHGQVRENPELVLQEANLLQIDRTIPRVVIVFDLLSFLAQMPKGSAKQRKSSAKCLSEWQQLRRRLLIHVRENFPTGEGNLSAFPDENCLVVLATIDPQQPEKWPQQLKRTVQHTLEELRRLTNTEVQAGIGDYYACWQSLTRSYEDACFALEVGSTLYSSEQIFTVDDLGLAAFVCSEDQNVLTKLTAHLLCPLLEEPELLNTLEIFLQTNLSPSQAAEKLHIHRHTLAYRLQKIADLTGADPRDFHTAAKLLAALFWHKCKASVM